MIKRTILFGVVGAAMLGIVSGCATEAPADDDVQATVAEGDVDSNGFLIRLTCDGAPESAHQKASALVKFGFGNDNAIAFPNTPACGKVKAALLELRDGLVAGRYEVIHGSTSICGINTAALHIWAGGQHAWNMNLKLISPLSDNTDACFGTGVDRFLIPTFLEGLGFSYMFMDPEPATLTADLTSTQGAAAAAFFSNTGLPTRAKKWGATFAACGSAVLAGEPCSTTALSAGEDATRLILKNGTLCRCL